MWCVDLGNTQFLTCSLVPAESYTKLLVFIQSRESQNQEKPHPSHRRSSRDPLHVCCVHPYHLSSNVERSHVVYVRVKRQAIDRGGTGGRRRLSNGINLLVLGALIYPKLTLAAICPDAFYECMRECISQPLIICNPRNSANSLISTRSDP